MEPKHGGSTSARAEELRASLGARRQVEELLAEASAARRAAAADADALVEEAQELSAELVAESRREADTVVARAHEEAQRVLARARDEADGTTRQARAAADAVRARAEAEVEEHRRRVRQEVTDQVVRELAEANRRELLAQHERQDAMVGDLEASVRILGVSLESASANVEELLGALDALRAHTGDALGPDVLTDRLDAPYADRLAEPDAARADDWSAAALDARFSEPVVERVEVEVVEVVGPFDVVGDDDPDDVPDDELDDRRDAGPDADLDDELQRSEPSERRDPAGDEHDWTRPPSAPRSAAEARDDLFRVTASERRGRDLWSARDAEEARVAERATAPEEAEDRPMSATEAFLRSAHIDHGDPPLPPMDDDDTGARYARDAMRATARARSRQDEETLGVPPERTSGPRTGADERGERQPAVPSRPDSSGHASDRDPGTVRRDREGKPLGWLFRSS